MKNSRYLAILLIACIFYGCGAKSVHFESQLNLNNGNPGLKHAGANIYVHTHNEYLISDTLVLGYVPVPGATVEENRFASYYYYEKLGSYDNPIKQPNYFIVELVINPIAPLIIDITSLKLEKSDNSIITPNKYHVSKAWVIPKKRHDKGALNFNEILCSSNIKGLTELSAVENVKDVNITSPTCIILNFPIPPIHPREEFSFVIGKANIASEEVVNMEFNFTGKRVKDSSYISEIGP